MSAAPVEIPAELRAEVDALRADRTTGPVTIGGREHLAWDGVLVTPECYAAMTTAGALPAR